MRCGIFVLSLLLSLSHPDRSDADDNTSVAGAGRQLALKYCASCHVVAPNQEEAPVLKPAASSFEEIAAQPKIDAFFLQGFLSSTQSNVGHPAAMPNPQLTSDQIHDVAAYILNLRKKTK
jgi:mono/diheme cytochrome c family protein